MPMKYRIVNTIKRNLISTSQVSDCLDKSGALIGLCPLNHGHFRVGPVRFAYAYNCSNWELHEQLQETQAGEVVIVEAINCENYAVLGELVSKFTILYRQAAALVVHGLVRDIGVLRKENYPIWCSGTTPLGCFNKKNQTGPDKALLKEFRNRYKDAIAICDDSGVVVIPNTHITEDFHERLSFIELQEDAWFHSIDTDGFTTYETVCEKRYLDKGSVFSKYDQLKKDIGSA
jgi:4-hydroxy-4-methyl-2-oxoglutarate aldolase